jgi:hypothetical protein
MKTFLEESERDSQKDETCIVSSGFPPPLKRFFLGAGQQRIYDGIFDGIY